MTVLDRKIETVVTCLAEVLGRVSLSWGYGDLAEVKEHLAALESCVEGAIALVDSSPHATIEVNGHKIVIPAGKTTGQTVKAYAERAGLPKDWILYRSGGDDPISRNRDIVLANGDKFVLVEGIAVTVMVNGRPVMLPHTVVTGVRIKYAAERQASIPRHRDLYRGEKKVENEEMVTVEAGEEFTMRGAL